MSEVTGIFPVDHQLNDELRFDQVGGELGLRRSNAKYSTLPGQPRVRLDQHELQKYLQSEFLLPQLDRLAPKLWLVATPRSSQVSPLHHQAVRGRMVILCENPQLHLVWYYDRIFVKPIPKYLLSQAFWQYLDTQPFQLREAALGFMRTYSYLIRYEADFRVAQEKGLIPKSEGSSTGSRETTFETFAELITWFDRLSDDCVAPRYSYGELRLTRLNFYSRIFLRKLTFHHVDAQLGSFLNHAVAPFITGFVIISVILNALQVELTAQPNNAFGTRWTNFAALSRWVSVVALGLAAFTAIFVLTLMTTIFVHDMWFAMSMVQKKKGKNDGSWRTKKICVV